MKQGRQAGPEAQAVQVEPERPEGLVEPERPEGLVGLVQQAVLEEQEQ